MKKTLIQYSCVLISAGALVFSTYSFAQETFSGFNPNWSSLSQGVERATTRAQREALSDRAEDGLIDTRGTRINVPNSLIETTSTGSRSVMANSVLRWHNPLSSTFKNPTSSRWYQKDGNTQVFRVFPGDENLSSSREGAGRSEAFAYNLTTVESDGKKLTFSARYHVAKHNSSRDVKLFQSKARGLDTISGTYPAWGIALWVEKDGDIILVKRNEVFSRNEKIDTGYSVGQSFNLRIVDDGYSYKAFINNVEKASGVWERGDSPTVARWGAYVQGGSNGVLTGSVDDPIIVYVSGARVTLD